MLLVGVAAWVSLSLWRRSHRLLTNIPERETDSPERETAPVREGGVAA